VIRGFTYFIAVLAALAVVPAAGADVPGFTLSGFGTPSIDGVFTPGEWSGATGVNVTLNTPGGGTTPAMIYAMNDTANLYLALRVARPSLDSTSSVTYEFDNLHVGSFFAEGDDRLVLSAVPGHSTFSDGYRTMRPPCLPGSSCALADTITGGTVDGGGAVSNDGAFSTYELWHPLNDGDDAHDFSLQAGDIVGWFASILLCNARGCVSTSVPAFGGTGGDILIEPFDKTPPETRIASGPSGFAASRDAVFAFTGSDDVSAADKLTFACSLDGAAFTACTSPVSYSGLSEGAHTFAVRAADEAGNVDPTPAAQTWTVDVTPPETTITDAPPAYVPSRDATIAFTGSDNLGPDVSFECSVDGAPFAECTSPASLTGLSEGQHTFAVRAIDEAGNVDPTPATTTWTVDVTPPSLSLRATPNTLWPANHKLVAVSIDVQASDASGTVTVVLVSATSSEGDTASDVQGAAIGTDDRALLLRAERNGSGSGRVYTLTYRATDAAGNTTTKSVTVLVPHDARG
jgi:hypothetical protein